MGKDATREERLAAALRENLRRRKAQQRGDSGDPQASGEPAEQKSSEAG